MSAGQNHIVSPFDHTPVALTIAGSDSGGGAGIQADLKSFSARGVFGTSAITAITAQNTLAVTAIQAIDLPVVAAQIKAVLDDIHPHAIKIGMLADSGVIKTVVEALKDYHGPVVLDPVMIAKSGDALLQDDSVDTLSELLLPRATLLTPNLPEAARLLGTDPAYDLLDAVEQGKQLLDKGPAAILMKGGHARGPICRDVLITRDAEPLVLEVDRIDTKNTHGTGCSLSASIAAELAKGKPTLEAVKTAHSWLHEAIVRADSLTIGTGHGPVHHFHEFWNDDRKGGAA
ncbi:bifunctional hydroxymethylpyrimidine kinase/phosphomethylpyrimidine kinase [Kiloniella sp. b19]|uniref:bifunctional hydroxymethylpyrimidine kinase/phosphomethylpyrimidine kinase n=1 Tax=Kiloniella sp. GXU_MW_B19 TaxID=3141326 RepID=UPI0031CDDC0D